MKPPYPKRVYVAVAAVIAAAAFAVGQIQPGAGVLVVISASLGWVVWNSQRSVTRG